MTGSGPSSLAIVAGPTIGAVLEGREREIMAVVADAYRRHATGRSINPPSRFLHLPGDDGERIIALPAYLAGEPPVAGLKWISSVPGNTARNLQRAAGVIVLNSVDTGYPTAILEASRISAHRTAALAAMAATALHPRPTRGRAIEVPRIAVIGAGPIARTVLRYLAASGYRAERLLVHDRVAADAARFVEHARADGAATVAPTLADAVEGADLVVFATTAPAPYVEDAALFAGAPTILNVSLRDLSPEIILAGQNVFDDVDHCLTAGTSPHLAEQRVGGRTFVAGTLHDVMAGTVAPDPSRARIFSPFGLGVLDILVAGDCLAKAEAAGTVTRVDDFLAGMARW